MFQDCVQNAMILLRFISVYKGKQIRNFVNKILLSIHLYVSEFLRYKCYNKNEIDCHKRTTFCNSCILNVLYIECEGWRRHSSLIFLILLFTKPNIEVSGWLYQTKTHFTHIVYQPFSRVSPPSFTLYCKDKVRCWDSCSQLQPNSVRGAVVIGCVLLCPSHNQI